MRPIIEVKNLSKLYHISHEQNAAYRTFRGEITKWLKKPLGRTPKKEELWALKDVNFTVKEGEVLGVIGRNGAGKSTLLKILSRVTTPTSGRAILRGRVGSLLEVGTGFHPELTGRENIFLNGALLGMSQKEIKRKFDEIVAFSEIEKFLDTPVKFYSSGMYVRLAFAVAAHLEPEILIVDEVLAVGDTAFQKKCLGKMSEVAKGGRTILFVSHNMGAIRTLCSRGILLENGGIVKEGRTGEVVGYYLSSGISKAGYILLDRKTFGEDPFLKSVAVKVGGKEKDEIPFQSPFSIEIVVESPKDQEAVLGIGLTNELGQVVTTVHTSELGRPESAKTRELTRLRKGLNKFVLNFSENPFRPGRYYLSVNLFNRRLVKNYDHRENTLSFEVTLYQNRGYFDERQEGLFFPTDLTWERQ